MDFVDCLNRLAHMESGNDRQRLIERFIHLDSSDPECCSSSDDVVGMSSLADSSVFGTGFWLSTSIV